MKAGGLGVGSLTASEDVAGGVTVFGPSMDGDMRLRQQPQGRDALRRELVRNFAQQFGVAVVNGLAQ